MFSTITGHPPYLHNQVDLPLPDIIHSGTLACKRCAKLLTPQEMARYPQGEAHCNECTWEMWRDIRWTS